MKFLTAFILVSGNLICSIGMAQMGNFVDSIVGQFGSASYKQYNIGIATPTTADSAQLEIVSEAWTCFPVICNFRSIIWFDVSKFSQSLFLDSAKLMLTPTLNNINGIPGTPMYGTANASEVYLNISPIPGIVTWNNQPQVDLGNVSIIKATNSNSITDIDITIFVEKWIKGLRPNYGITMRLQNEIHYNSMIFHSGKSTIQNAPKLKIYYHTNDSGIAQTPNTTTYIGYNYTDDGFTIFFNDDIGSLAENIEVEIFDDIARLVYAQPYNFRASNQLSLSANKINMAAGNYFVRLGNEKYQKVLRLLVN
ncbi:MAG: DNRLRE domain-containing protein [Bacteroidetes bacterium]|nr:DNRLRE domain-containing protein [Bacteroidota bacterium]